MQEGDLIAVLKGLRKVWDARAFEGTGMTENANGKVVFCTFEYTVSLSGSHELFPLHL